MFSLAQLQEIPPRNLVLLVGPPGSGKTTFCGQTILKSLAMDRPIIYVVTEYGPSEAEKALKEHGLGEVERGLLNYVDAYNETVGAAVSDRVDTVYADCNDLSSIDIAILKLQERIGSKGTLLVFDSLTSPYLFSGAEILRFMRQTLSRFAASGNAVLACIDEGCGKSEDLVAMMSLSNGVIKMETEEGKQFLNVVKHPKLKMTRIEASLEPEPISLEERVFNPDVLVRFLRGEEALMRGEVGDFVNLFWPNFAYWSGMLWDPKRFPTMSYELVKELEVASAGGMFKHLPWYMKLLMKFMPKNLSDIKNMKKVYSNPIELYRKWGVQVTEYLEDISKKDEHHFKMQESYCWGLENIGARCAFQDCGLLAGDVKALESLKGTGTLLRRSV